MRYALQATSYNCKVKMHNGLMCRLFSNLKAKPVKIIQTQGHDIYFNLAIEEYLFQKAQISTPTLFLWKNSPTIVIGKHQNPWKQCKVQQMKNANIKLSRRKTGGGAVYQDLGNTCFSFITPYQKQDKLQYRTINNHIILDALVKLGVNAEVSGRNDMVINGKKFSGSAYRLHLGGKDGTGKRSLHHGTIMFNVDFQALNKYLNPSKKKLQSKGIDSVISRVINLNDYNPTLNHEIFCEELQKSFRAFYGNQQVQEETLSYKDIKERAILLNFQRLKSWDWLYGECPYFKYIIEKKFNWGLTEVTFEVFNGKINKCKIYSDCLFPDFITWMTEELVEISYDAQSLKNLADRLGQDGILDNHQWGSMGADLCNWIITEI